MRMTLNEYIKSKNLTLSAVAQACGVSRQAISQYSHGSTPNAKSLMKVAKGMTELGVPTTAADLLPCWDSYED